MPPLRAAAILAAFENCRDERMQEREAMIEKTRVMLAMQNDMNSHVDADWLQRQREWYLQGVFA